MNNFITFILLNCFKDEFAIWNCPSQANITDIISCKLTAVTHGQVIDTLVEFDDGEPDQMYSLSDSNSSLVSRLYFLPGKYEIKATLQWNKAYATVSIQINIGFRFNCSSSVNTGDWLACYLNDGKNKLYVEALIDYGDGFEELVVFQSTDESRFQKAYSYPGDYVIRVRLINYNFTAEQVVSVLGGNLIACYSF
jgi:hypothetical protein